MNHPKRYMRDGTATTTRAHDVVRVPCSNPSHVECYEAITSWAGQPLPSRDTRWHIYVSKSDAVCLLGPLVGRESVQFQEGLKRRVRNKRSKGA